MNLTSLNAAFNHLVGWARSGFNNHKVRLDALDANKANFKFGRYISSSTELNNEKNSTPSQQTVFNSWYRFSHDQSLVFPAIPAETSTWNYNSGTGKISNTTNSVSTIGVISQEKYDDYVFDVRLTSTNLDDDAIGIILAWYKDPVDGREYTLSVSRSPGGLWPLYGLIYNFGQGNPGGAQTFVPGSDKVTWGNNAAGSLSAAAAGWQSNTPGWGGMAAFQGTDGSVRLWAERKGDIIKVKTSQWATPNVLDENTLLTVDLSQDARFQKFRGPSQYGLLASSQQDSFWEVLQFTNTKDAIYDMISGEVWVNTNGAWSVSPTLSIADLGENVILINKNTATMYVLKDENTRIMFNGGIIVPEPPP